MEPPSGNRPAPHLGHAEDGALARDPEVHGLEDLGAAGDGVALDGGDQRLAGLEVAQQRLPVQVRIGVEARRPLVVGMPGRHRLEVGTGAEVASGAGDDDDADLGIRVELRPRVAHPDEHLAGQGVAGLGSVEGDGDDVPVALDEQMRFGQRATSRWT